MQPGSHADRSNRSHLWPTLAVLLCALLALDLAQIFGHFGPAPDGLVGILAIVSPLLVISALALMLSARHSAGRAAGPSDVVRLPPRRILLIDRGTLLEAGIKRLLEREADLQVAAVRPLDRAALAADIRRLCPDVIVTSEGSDWASLPCLLELLKECPTVRVVEVCPQTNLLRTYDKDLVLGAEVIDLLSFIRRSDSSTRSAAPGAREAGAER
jgi:hypothetical protein